MKKTIAIYWWGFEKYKLTSTKMSKEAMLDYLMYEYGEYDIFRLVSIEEVETDD